MLTIKTSWDLSHATTQLTGQYQTAPLQNAKMGWDILMLRTLQEQDCIIYTK